jgi:hypothetical protein
MFPLNCPRIKDIFPFIDIFLALYELMTNLTAGVQAGRLDLVWAYFGGILHYGEYVVMKYSDLFNFNVYRLNYQPAAFIFILFICGEIVNLET